MVKVKEIQTVIHWVIQRKMVIKKETQMGSQMGFLMETQMKMEIMKVIQTDFLMETLN